MRKERDEWKRHWTNMPEFVQEKQTHYGEIIVRFETEKDSDKFFDVIGQSRPQKLKSIWFPKREKIKNPRVEYIDES